ncbi:MAG: cupin domain-containing protein [Planctomycetes bacterium]|nr:cupin domain-containing protein [Planctomycetota bacterium]
MHRRLRVEGDDLDLAAGDRRDLSSVQRSSPRAAPRTATRIAARSYPRLLPIEVLDLAPFLAPGERLRVERPGSTARFVAHRLPAGQQVPLHDHPETDEIFVVLAGEGTLEVGGETKDLRAPMAFLVPRGVSHRLSVSPGGPMALIVMKSLRP